MTNEERHKALGIVRRAVVRELGGRQDTLVRAKMEKAADDRAGRPSDVYLSDYEDDVHNGELAMELIKELKEA